MLYDGPLKGCTWNAQALFARDIGKYRRNMIFVNDLMNDHDFLTITEAHVTEGEMAAWKSP